jgi:hypothetical protein
MWNIAENPRGFIRKSGIVAYNRLGGPRSLRRGVQLKKWRETRAFTFNFVIARSEATWQSMQRFSFLERRSKREGRLDCRGPLRGPRKDEDEGECMVFLRSRFAWQDIPSIFNRTLRRG